MNLAEKYMQDQMLIYDLRIEHLGKPAFVIVKIDKPKQRAFEKAMESSSPFDIGAFGEVIASGYGEPSLSQKTWLHEKFGMYS